MGISLLRNVLESFDGNCFQPLFDDLELRRIVSLYIRVIVGRVPSVDPALICKREPEPLGVVIGASSLKRGLSSLDVLRSPLLL